MDFAVVHCTAPWKKWVRSQHYSLFCLTVGKHCLAALEQRECPREDVYQARNKAQLTLSTAEKEEVFPTQRHCAWGPCTYILVGHFPVWSLSVGHDLPHDNAIAPRITCRRELSVGNSFWGRPPYRDFSTLKRNRIFLSCLLSILGHRHPF